MTTNYTPYIDTYSAVYPAYTIPTYYKSNLPTYII